MTSGKMSRLFNKLKKGLEEAIAHKKGELELKTEEFDVDETVIGECHLSHIPNEETSKVIRDAEKGNGLITQSIDELFKKTKI